jgi:transposase
MAQEPTSKTPAKAAEASPDEVEKFLNEQKTLEAHRQELIRELLREKEAAIKAFDEKLARLGYNGAKPRRSHHKQAEDKKA